MKAKLFSCLFILTVSIQVLAQDTIYKTSGAKVIAKVTEINASSVKYTYWGNPHAAGETLKDEVAYIVYSNGLKELYNNMAIVPKAVPVSPVEYLPYELKEFQRNIIAMNCFDILFTNLSVSYERIFKSGKYSLKIPVAVGLGGKPNENIYSGSNLLRSYYMQNRIYSGGLEFNIYPFAQTRHTFYLGISGGAGSFYYYNNIYGTLYYSYNGSSYTGVIGKERRIASHYYGTLHIGGYIRLSEEFSIGTKFGLGYKHEETIHVDYTSPKIQFDLNLAYRF